MHAQGFALYVTKFNPEPSHQPTTQYRHHISRGVTRTHKLETEASHNCVHGSNTKQAMIIAPSIL